MGNHRLYPAGAIRWSETEFSKDSGDWPQVRTGDPDRTCELDSGVGVIPTALGAGLMDIPHGSDWSAIREAGMKADKRAA